MFSPLADRLFIGYDFSRNIVNKVGQQVLFGSVDPTVAIVKTKQTAHAIVYKWAKVNEVVPKCC